MITTYRNISYKENLDCYRVKIAINGKVYDKNFKSINLALAYRNNVFELENVKIKE